MSEHQALVNLGFSKMEAAVYIHLLTNPGQTGYAISKALGEAAPYIYRTLDSLSQKGSVISELAEKSVYRAVPYSELIAQLKNIYDRQCEQAEHELRKLQDIGGDNRIYTLSTIDQVFERCRAMLSRCNDIAYMDLYPEPFSRLRDDIEQIQKRGKRVSLFLYNNEEVEVTRTVQIDSSRIIKHWKRQWIRVGIDGSEYLVALLNADGKKVYHAVWSENPVLAWTQMYSLRSELQLAELVHLIDDNASIEDLKENLTHWRSGDNAQMPIGAKKLERRFEGIK